MARGTMACSVMLLALIGCGGGSDDEGEDGTTGQTAGDADTDADADADSDADADADDGQSSEDGDASDEEEDPFGGFGDFE